MNILQTLLSHKPYKNISFSALKKVEYSRDFNPKKSKNDYMVLNSVFLSNAFRYLIKNRDVYLDFDKFKSKSDGKVYTVLHYKYEPLKKKVGFWQDAKSLLKKCLNPNNQCKFAWLSGWSDPVSGERELLTEKILDYPLEDMKKTLGENQ